MVTGFVSGFCGSGAGVTVELLSFSVLLPDELPAK
jgi:hypothetical protein